MAPFDFLRVLYNSSCLVGNSSAGIRECSFLGIPVVNIGSRQQGRDRGVNVFDVDYDRREIGQAIERHLSNGRYPQDTLYGDGRAGERIAALLSPAPSLRECPGRPGRIESLSEASILNALPALDASRR